MSVAAISKFLLSLAAMGVEVFGKGLTPSDWHVLLSLGREWRSEGLGGAQVSPAKLDSSAPPEMWPRVQSYKSLKCAANLSDDALSRSLRRLNTMGLVSRQSCDDDQRVIYYSLTAKAEQGFNQIAYLVAQEFGALLKGLTTSIAGKSRSL